MSLTRALVAAPLVSARAHGLGPAAPIGGIDRVDIEGARRA